MKKKKKLIIILSVIFTPILLVILASAIYINDYYHAEPSVNELLSQSYEDLEIKNEYDSLEFIPKNPKAGLIFYPGGKVEYTAYAPLMLSLAQEGILVVMPHVTFNLAVLEINAADGIQNRFTNVDNWYLSGHSLGGAMASTYLANHLDEYEGIILLGAYLNKDISNTNENVLLIHGSNDLVLSMSKYEEKKAYLPSVYTELTIEGGNHAYYGNYGNQKKDGIATITQAEQQRQTKEAIIELMNINKTIPLA